MRAWQPDTLQAPIRGLRSLYDLDTERGNPYCQRSDFPSVLGISDTSRARFDGPFSLYLFTPQTNFSEWIEIQNLLAEYRSGSDSSSFTSRRAYFLLISGDAKSGVVRGIVPGRGLRIHSPTDYLS